MKSMMVARPYAEALLELAQTEEEETSKVLNQLSAIVEGSELNEVFENPTFTHEERHAILDTLIQRMKIRPVVQKFLKLLVDRGRINYLPLIAQAYLTLLNAKHGVVQAKVTVATPLTSMQQKKLESELRRLSGHEVVTQVIEDPDLIGGLVVEMNGVVRDASVRGQLEHLRSAIKRATC